MITFEVDPNRHLELGHIRQVSGPLNALALGPNPLDGAFGPAAVSVRAPPVQNASLLDGAFQHFGAVRIDGRSRELTVDLCDATGSVLFSQRLAAPVG